MQKLDLTEGQHKIIVAALTLLNKDGLEQLTLRHLAKALDIQAPAVYWHFKSKSALIDYMAEAILQEEFSDLTHRGEAEEWQEWLKDLMRRLRRAMLRYRDGGRVVAGAHLYPALTLLNIGEIGIQSLLSAGLPLQEAHTLVVTLIHFTFGRVIEEQASPSPEVMNNFDLAGMAKTYPALARIMGTLENRSADSDFENSLRLIIG
jgi:TetR/AcrR family transcriptional regulator, tetracycline repressor protein